jgi:hypothetical protein
MADLNLKIIYIAKSNLQETARYKIDFVEISQSLAIGVERFDIAGDTRKTIQHTKGSQQTDDFSGSMYVDTWAVAPNTIALAGVVKIPEGSTVPVTKVSTDRGVTWTTYKSFIDTVEDFYNWSSSPSKVSNQNELRLYDFIRREELKVTIKSRRFPIAIDRPFLVPFEINFIALERTQGLQITGG